MARWSWTWSAQPTLCCVQQSKEFSGNKTKSTAMEDLQRVDVDAKKLEELKAALESLAELTDDVSGNSLWRRSLSACGGGGLPLHSNALGASLIVVHRARHEGIYHAFLDVALLSRPITR